MASAAPLTGLICMSGADVVHGDSGGSAARTEGGGVVHACGARRPRAPLIADANKKPLAGLFTHLFGALFISFYRARPSNNPAEPQKFLFGNFISLSALALSDKYSVLALSDQQIAFQVQILEFFLYPSS
jgi:hypothetical protein